MGVVGGRVDVEVDCVVLEVGGVHDAEGFGVLHWDYVSVSEMEVEVVGLGAHGEVLAGDDGLACLGLLDDIAPGSGWEVEIGGVNSNLVGKDTELKSAADHDVVLLIQGSLSIIWELEEEWLDEGTSLSAVD